MKKKPAAPEQPMTKQWRHENDAGPSYDAVRPYLARLLGSAAFKATPQRRKLLKYSVEHSLAGRHDRLKAFELGVVVLGRNDRFDPQTDPIVRIEMGRLRRELEHYYQTAGHDDPIWIAIPRGNYLPVFPPRYPPPPATALPMARAKLVGARWRVPAAALAALCLLV